MANLNSVLKGKEGTICSVAPGSSVAECIRLMKELNIGSVVVMESNKVVGLFTERVAVRVIYLNLKDLDLEATPVSDVMDKEITFAAPDTSVEEAMMLFTNKRTRHLPVIENNQLIGLVSIGDVTKWIMEQQKSEIDHLSDYIQGDTR